MFIVQKNPCSACMWRLDSISTALIVKNHCWQYWHLTRFVLQFMWLFIKLLITNETHLLSWKPVCVTLMLFKICQWRFFASVSLTTCHVSIGHFNSIQSLTACVAATAIIPSGHLPSTTEELQWTEDLRETKELRETEELLDGPKI